MPQNKDENVCSPCENEMNQEKTLPFNDETGQDNQAESGNKVDASSLSFPQNGATTACYVTALILVAAAVLLYSSTSPVFTLLMAGIACVLAGNGKSVKVIYAAIIGIYNTINREDYTTK